MRKSLSVFASLLTLSIVSFGQEQEQKLVKQVFEDYKSAILNDKGDEAANYVDSRTVKYYGEMLEIIKTGDSAKVNALSLIDKITVFSVRHTAVKEDILPMNGKDLFVYAIKNGMVGKNSVSQNAVGKVTVNKEFATGQLVVNGQETPLYFHFYKEQQQWRIDLTSIFAVSNAAFKNMVEESGEEENEYIFQLLEIMTGTKPGPETWNPVSE